VFVHIVLIVTVLAFGFFEPASAADDRPSTQSSVNYASAAREVTAYVQRTFVLPEENLYARSITDRRADYMWGNGIEFSALVGAARHDPTAFLPILSQFFQSMDRYWDKLDTPPGYEPAPTRGGAHGKYYDDNAWMVLTFTEAYELTHEQRYLDRAEQTLDFVLSGWDEQRGGGIWWQERHEDGSKNPCVNAPAAVACLRVARYETPEKAKARIAMAHKLVDWTAQTFEESGLYSDSIVVASGKIRRGKLTYNTALMIRAFLGLYRATHNEDDLNHAKRCAMAADWFVDQRTGGYRDPPKWSHLLIEADLELYRATHEGYLFNRAARAADCQYHAWRQKPPAELIDNAAIARALWLMADTQSDNCGEFWSRLDGDEQKR